MSKPIIEVTNLSKLYKLGSIGSTTLRESCNRAWYRLIGKQHLARKIGEKDLMIPADHPQAGSEPNTFWALKDVSFNVEQGDIVGIIGKNGAGKSTLLKILSHITEPTAGRAVIRGRVGSLLEVGTGFHPELTGRENTYLNGAILGMRKKEIDRKFDEIVAFAEVDKFVDTPVKRYSSGMYVRLAFAVAAHLEPEVLIVDEVLAVGDTEFQAKCLGKMKDVSSEGRTVLFVSHNIGAIRTLCMRSILLRSSYVAIDAVTADTLSEYMNYEATSESQWVRSGNGHDTDGVYLEEIAIVDGVGRTIATAAATQGFSLRIVVSATATLPNTQIAVRVTNSEGVPVFTTASTDASDSLMRIPIGRHAYRIDIPGDFLPPGVYYLTVATMIPRVVCYDSVDGAVKVRIEDDGHRASRIDDDRLGVVSPVYPWYPISAPALEDVNARLSL